MRRRFPPQLSGWSAAAEWGWVLALTPVLLFPEQAGLLLPLGILLAVPRWFFQVLKGTFGLPHGPFVPPTVVLGLMAVIGVWISDYPAVSLPKWTGLLLGILWMRVVMLTCTTQVHLRRILAVHVVIGVAFTVTGLIGTCVPCWVTKWGPLRPWALEIPQVFSQLPGTALGGVSPNAIGATTLFFIPLIVAMWYGAIVQPRRDSLVQSLALHLGFASLLGFFVVALLMSQSRTSWGSALLVTSLVAFIGLPIRARRWGALIALVTIVGAGHFFVAGGAVAAQSRWPQLLSVLPERQAIWSAALDHMLRAPLTGIGLGTFRKVAFASQGTTGETSGPAHAHNVFLQTALDVGIPGLLAYLALVCIALVLCRYSYLHGSQEQRSIALGLGGSLVAIHLFGLTDAVALGAKIGTSFWVTIGMIGALSGIIGWDRAPGP